MSGNMKNEKGALHVEGNRLVDQNGNTVQLRGISTHGINWYPQYVNQALFNEFKNKWHMNVVRLAMYTGEGNGYCTGGNKDVLKGYVKNGVKYATNAGLYAIIDWHILSDADPNIYKEESKKFFDEMSKEFASYDNVIYELCNEPNSGTSWEAIKSYAEEVIPVIRKNAPNAIIIVGTPQWSQLVNEAYDNPIKDENIMYTLHFYAGTHKDDLRSLMESTYLKGLPIFVTEYGICDASGNGALDYESADKWVNLMNQYQISYIAWNLSNKDESSSILKATTGKVSGINYEDLNDSGKWLFRVLNGTEDLSGNTEVNQNTETNAAEDTKVDSVSENESHMITNDEIEIKRELVNSWDDGSKKFYQYRLTLKNVSGSESLGWKVKLTFEDEYEFSSGWNGNFKKDGLDLYITSMDYNGTVSDGSETYDIGFIVSGSELK